MAGSTTRDDGPEQESILDRIALMSDEDDADSDSEHRSHSRARGSRDNCKGKDKGKGKGVIHDMDGVTERSSKSEDSIGDVLRVDQK